MGEQENRTDEKEEGRKVETRPRKLELEPELKVRRLNRVAVLGAAIVVMLVFWVAYFVLSQRAPVGEAMAGTKSAGTEADPATIDRLQKEARPLWVPPERDPFLRPAEPPPSSPAVRNIEDPRKERRRKAMEAALLVPAFSRRSVDAPEREENPAALSIPAWALPGGLPGAEAGDGQPRQTRRPTSRHRAFLEEAERRGPAETRRASLQAPASPFTLTEGTLIPAILAAGIHSDLPGQTHALVRRNVYDSTAGRHLLIPQGSRLVGSYDHEIVWGQKRVLLAWHRLIFPDGRSLDLRGIPGVDLAARAGLQDQARSHLLRTFGSALMLSAVSAGAQLSQPQESADGVAPSTRQVAAGALGQELGRVATELLRRQMDVEPTLRIRPGYRFHVAVTSDLVFPGPYAKAERRAGR